ncbi:S8 family serine peptidase [Levilinea saccharolytica]|uniref:S8 family serine peptidase n=1 Tax=Levilinea saccharolytica TaxID=229921 RepID=UPI0007844518|nr:S8 family serine peptidase [Levilinea saccharolytica]GAP17107.1 subtilisin-like serine proteases [Levilinea saccharolytica]
MRTRLLHSLIITMLALALVPLSPAAAQPAPQEDLPAAGDFVPGELVVGFDKNLLAAETGAQASALAGQIGAQVVSTGAGMALLSFDESADVAALAQEVQSQPGVVFAEPNYIFSLPEPVESTPIEELREIAFEGEDGPVLRDVSELKSLRTLVRKGGKTLSIPTYPSDPLSYTQWGHWKIGAHIIWPEKKVSPTVCVIDTGVDANHPDLKGRVINGFDFVNNDKIPNDDNGHGTHVAGIIAARANNGREIWGVSNGKVIAVKVLGSQGRGTNFNIALGITFCANSPARVINMSLGGSPSTATYNALDYAINTKNKFVAAAAGNSSTSDTFSAYPAAYAKDIFIGYGLVSVAAAQQNPVTVDTNGNDAIVTASETFENCAADFSNYGSWVELVAPGDDIYSTLPLSYPFYQNYRFGLNPGADTMSGTSMASPYVAAVAARVWSLFPGYSTGDLETHLVDYGRVLSLAVDPSVSGPSFGFFATGYSGTSPFCWPNATAPYGAAQNMTNARYVDASLAMGRSGISFNVMDAQTALPLTGAVIRAMIGGKLLDISRLDSMTSNTVDLINLPSGPSFSIQAAAKGYLAGFQTIYPGVTVAPGVMYSGTASTYLAIPSGRFINVVTTYRPGTAVEVFLYLPAAVGGSVWALNVGNLYEAPFAFYNRDNFVDGYPVTAVTVMNNGKNPYYPGEYYVVINSGTSTLNTAGPTVRVFSNGKMINYVLKGDICTSGEGFWRAGRVTSSASGVQFIVDDNCGGSEVLP